MVIFAITGKFQTGKTTLAQRLVTVLRDEGYTCGGVLCPGRDYRVYVNLITGIAHQFYCPGDDLIDFDCREISEEAIEFGQRAIKEAAKAGVDVLFVDEVGKLENQKEGFYQPLQNILPKRKKPVVTIIRNEVVPEFKKLFNVPLDRIWGLDVNTDRENILMEIVAEISKSLHRVE
ncbi:MAG: nucleoside-triphosphatase [Candidatus Odinarchaeota archaeon]